jgi:methionine sulfoxide reductase heme-binding subunit
LIATTSSGPSPLWFATRGAGIMTLVCLTVVVILGISTSLRMQGRRTPRFVTAALHRNFSLFTLVLLAVHIATSVLDPFAGIRPVDAVIPFGGAYRTFWLGLGVLAAEVLLGVTLTSILRGKMGPRLWRLVHWATYASWPIAVAHGLGTGSDVQAPWMIGLTAACMVAVIVAIARRLLVGRIRTLPVRGVAAGVAVVSTFALCAWAFGGPLQSGWALKAGTPRSILTSRWSAHPARSTRNGFADPMIGTLSKSGGGIAVALRDTVDTALTVVITGPGSTQTLPELTIARNGHTVCARVAARVSLSLYAVCGTTRLVITLYGTAPSITGQIVTSGPL